MTSDTDTPRSCSGMNLSRVQQIVEAELLVGSPGDIELQVACGADLMSDVLAHIKWQFHGA